MAAFWLADNEEVKIVHLGSGSGSTLNCVLAESSINFLRLLAIGYDEICWSDEFASAPRDNAEFIMQPNIEFQNWVRNAFNVTIPQTALDIVKHPSLMDDEQSEDEFWNWCQRFKQEEKKDDMLVVAKLMKETGIEIEIIIEATGLSAAEIEVVD